MSDISSIYDTTAVTSLATDGDRATIDEDEFMSILIAELQSQDPMEPMSNSDMAGQMAQIESLRASSELSEGFATLLRSQDVAAAGTLIGRRITGTNAAGEPVEGLVERVKIDRNSVNLVVDGFTVPIGNVLGIEPYVPPAEEQ